MKDASANIFLHAIDDDAEELEILQGILDENHITNYGLHTSKEEFFKHINADINLSLIDHKLSAATGLEVVAQVKAINEDNYAMILSDTKDFKVAVQYLNAGADKFLSKSDPDYKDRLVMFLKEGFATAEKRIQRANKIRELELQSAFRMQEIAQLAKKLNTDVRPNDS